MGGNENGPGIIDKSDGIIDYGRFFDEILQCRTKRKRDVRSDVDEVLLFSYVNLSHNTLVINSKFSKHKHLLQHCFPCPLSMFHLSTKPRRTEIVHMTKHCCQHSSEKKERKQFSSVVYHRDGYSECEDS